MGPNNGKVAVETGGGKGTDAGWRESATSDEIARLAYRLYEAHGRHDGHDVEDWLGAERALAWQYAYYGQ